MGFEGGEAFVEQVVSQGGVLHAKGGGNGPGLGGLRARGAIGVEGISDDERVYPVLADETGEGLEIGAEGGPMQGEKGLRGEAERVSDGEADAAVADVKGEGAGHGVSVELLSLSQELVCLSSA